MASIAYDDSSAPARLPISVHPAFPAVVALWFSALLGIGSLVLPAALLDRVVDATGLAAWVPAAAPPLGFTARSLIALAAAVAGALLGLVVARRVAAAHTPQAQSRIAKLAEGSRRPLSVNDELSAEKVVNGESLPINRRRALAISEDDRPSDFLYRAPLPGEDPAAEPLAYDEPLELDTPADDGAPAPGDEPAHELAAADLFADEPEQEEEMTERQVFQPLAEPEIEAVEPADRFKHLAGPRGLEPLPFAAPSLARRIEGTDLSDAEIEAEVEPAIANVEEAIDQAPALVAVEPGKPVDWISAPLADLGLVQLAQRLGASLERHREARAAAATAPVAAAPAVPEPFEAAPAQEAAEAMAAYFGGGAPNAATPDPFAAAPADEASEEAIAAAPVAVATPHFLRALQPLDDSDEDDAVPDFSLPLRRQAAAAPAFAQPIDEQPEADDDADAAAESSEYSSLLAMRNPFGAPHSEFVRIDEPAGAPDLPEPTVVFPGQERRESFAIPVTTNGQRLFDPPGRTEPAAGTPAPAGAEADAALRAALASLRKVGSGF